MYRKKSVSTSKERIKHKTVLRHGHKFPSELEADYYDYLLKQKESGKVLSIELQPKIVLQPKFSNYRGNFQAITYTPDYLVEYSDGEKLYIDVKGMCTDHSAIRRKIYEYQYQNGIRLVWIGKSKKYGNKEGWIDWDKLQNIRAENKKARAEKKEGA